VDNGHLCWCWSSRGNNIQPCQSCEISPSHASPSTTLWWLCQGKQFGCFCSSTAIRGASSGQADDCQASEALSLCMTMYDLKSVKLFTVRCCCGSVLVMLVCLKYVNWRVNVTSWSPGLQYSSWQMLNFSGDSAFIRKTSLKNLPQVRRSHTVVICMFT
jgi:hypothetical protein